MRRAVLAVAVLAVLAACAELKSAPDPAPAPPSSGAAEKPFVTTDASPEPPPSLLEDAGPEPDALPPDKDADVGPEEPCEPEVACLDAADPHVIEVPTEKTIEEAIATAKAGDTIQVRGMVLSGTQKLPDDVNLRGCQAARIGGDVYFGAGTATVEGFDVTGHIAAGNEGTFSIVRSRFSRILAAQDDLPAVSVVPTLLGTNIELSVKQCIFTQRSQGIQVLGIMTTGLRGLKLSVENSAFSRTRQPIVLDRQEKVPLFAEVLSSTFYDFETAITVKGRLMNEFAVVVDVSLFSNGKIGVDTTGSPYRIRSSFAHEIDNPIISTLAGSGELTEVDPSFVDPNKDDLRLARGSEAVNRIPNVVLVPRKDFYGCPRPAGAGIDPGAYESQP